MYAEIIKQFALVSRRDDMISAQEELLELGLVFAHEESPGEKTEMLIRNLPPSFLNPTTHAYAA